MRVPQISDAIGICQISVKYTINYLRATYGSIHIERWEVAGPANNRQVALYRFGLGEDAAMPAKKVKDRAEIEARQEAQRIYRAACERRKAQEAERRNRERAIREMAKPVRRDPFIAAFFGHAAPVQPVCGRVYKQDMTITDDDEVTA
ncbi:hypothetical protein [Paraburkholderia sp. HD33-4]|uniref:hypothetical protein n=1 Tax=Paraburkholderia sp. HD33-4 TaxID=2883242 RepID=UPI001F17FB7B|nr:hypothetical protein [Paraburkholderia sp. HD33-4]